MAFPVCISVNELCGHFSPLQDESTKLAAGDVVKIDLGIHIDGFIAMAGHTIVISNPNASPDGGNEESKEGDAQSDIVNGYGDGLGGRWHAVALSRSLALDLEELLA